MSDFPYTSLHVRSAGKYSTVDADLPSRAAILKKNPFVGEFLYAHPEVKLLKDHLIPPPQVVGSHLAACLLKTACASDSHCGSLAGGFGKFSSAALSTDMAQKA